MSKLYDKYLYLKKTEDTSEKTLYLFKSGIFFIFLGDDAKIASKLLSLKITYLTEEIIKCGFPVNSLEKYTNLLKVTPYKIKIIDNTNNTTYTISNYNTDKEVKNILNTILSINTNSLYVKEAYEFIENLKCIAQQIMKGESYNGENTE